MATISACGEETHMVNAYCDASVKDKKWGGCSWAIADGVKPERGFFGRAIALGKVDDVTTAELHGIRTVLEYLLEREKIGSGLGTHITIWTDCKHALALLSKAYDDGFINDVLREREEAVYAVGALLRKHCVHGTGVYIGWMPRCSMPGARIVDDWASTASGASRKGFLGIVHRYGQAQMDKGL